MLKLPRQNNALTAGRVPVQGKRNQSRHMQQRDTTKFLVHTVGLCREKTVGSRGRGMGMGGREGKDSQVEEQESRGRTGWRNLQKGQLYKGQWSSCTKVRSKALVLVGKVHLEAC